MESNDSPEIPDRERTSDTPGLTLEALTSEIRINHLSEMERKKLVIILFDAFFYKYEIQLLILLAAVVPRHDLFKKRVVQE